MTNFSKRVLEQVNIKLALFSRNIFAKAVAILRNYGKDEQL